MRRRIPDWLTLPRIAALFVLLVVILLVILTRLTAPPEFDFLAGPEDSTFYRDAMRFREILLRDGVKLNVVETKGTVDNLRLMLEAEGPTAAFADAVGAIDLTEEELLEDAGSDDEEDNRLDRVTSLGAIYLQPLWVFALAGTELGGIEEMDGARIGVGPEGSTSRMLTGLILRYVSGDVQTELVDIGGADETVAIDEVMQSLRSGAVDAVVAVGQPNARLVDRLLRADEFRAVRFERAAAYALHFPYLVPITLPEGGYDLGANVPNQDLHTLAASTELLVTDLFPPPLADLLLQASSEVYGEASLFTDRDAFPNPDMVSIRLNSSATRFFEQGPPLLRKVLPFQLATWIDRFIMVIVAFGSIAIGLFSVLPKLVGMHLDRQLQTAYRRMEEIEKQMDAGGDRQAALAEIDEIDNSTAEIRIYLRSGIASWLEMRQFLHDLRDRVAGA